MEYSKLLLSVSWRARCIIALGLRPRAILQPAVHGTSGSSSDNSTNRHEITVYYFPKAIVKQCTCITCAAEGARTVRLM